MEIEESKIHALIDDTTQVYFIAESNHGSKFNALFEQTFFRLLNTKYKNVKLLLEAEKSLEYIIKHRKLLNSLYEHTRNKIQFKHDVEHSCLFIRKRLEEYYDEFTEGFNYKYFCDSLIMSKQSNAFNFIDLSLDFYGCELNFAVIRELLTYVNNEELNRLNIETSLLMHDFTEKYEKKAKKFKALDAMYNEELQRHVRLVDETVQKIHAQDSLPSNIFTLYTQLIQNLEESMQYLFTRFTTNGETFREEKMGEKIIKELKNNPNTKFVVVLGADHVLYNRSILTDKGIEKISTAFSQIKSKYLKPNHILYKKILIQGTDRNSRLFSLEDKKGYEVAENLVKKYKSSIRRDTYKVFSTDSLNHEQDSPFDYIILEKSGSDY